MNWQEIDVIQKKICAKYKAVHYASPLDMKVGISLNVRSGVTPINGLRHYPTSDTTGWYLWAGTELSQDSDFFKPLHVRHLDEWCPFILGYLGLPPGWRFLIFDNYEDVWYDSSLLFDQQ